MNFYIWPYKWICLNDVSGYSRSARYLWLHNLACQWHLWAQIFVYFWQLIADKPNLYKDVSLEYTMRSLDGALQIQFQVRLGLDIIIDQNWNRSVSNCHTHHNLFSFQRRRFRQFARLLSWLCYLEFFILHSPPINNKSNAR